MTSYSGRFVALLLVAMLCFTSALADWKGYGSGAHSRTDSYSDSNKHGVDVGGSTDAKTWGNSHAAGDYQASGTSYDKDSLYIAGAKGGVDTRGNAAGGTGSRAYAGRKGARADTGGYSSAYKHGDADAWSGAGGVAIDKYDGVAVAGAHTGTRSNVGYGKGKSYTEGGANAGSTGYGRDFAYTDNKARSDPKSADGYGRSSAGARLDKRKWHGL